MSSMLDGLAVDPGSDRAVFRQIADQLRAVIQNGQLSEGDRLPSEAQLIDHYGVARMTIRNALQLLEAEGLLLLSTGGVCTYAESLPCAGLHRIVLPGVTARKAKRLFLPNQNKLVRYLTLT
jgi:DNA-binding FadR family transcriptional regulator